MAVFTYDAQLVKNWATRLINLFNGGSESIANCTTKFSNIMNSELALPDVWTGPAAVKNYNNFIETYNAVAKLFSDFGLEFTEMMKEINQNVASLETANLGDASSISGVLNDLSFEGVKPIDPNGLSNINKEYVRYAMDKIEDAAGKLNETYEEFQSVLQNMLNTISELDSGKGIFDGNAARASQERLSGVITKNREEINKGLTTCINNIKEAAESARNADRA